MPRIAKFHKKNYRKILFGNTGNSQWY